MEKETGLLPCPFCGAKQTSSSIDPMHVVHEPDCYLISDHVNRLLDDIKKYNTRVPDLRAIDEAIRGFQAAVVKINSAAEMVSDGSGKLIAIVTATALIGAIDKLEQIRSKYATGE